MVKSLNNDVLSKIDEIVLYIQESSTYKRYKAIEEKMQKDEDIMNKIALIKKYQKEIVRLEINKKDSRELDKKIELLVKELNKYPIYQEYTYLFEDLNGTFQSIKLIIENYINEILK